MAWRLLFLGSMCDLNTEPLRRESSTSYAVDEKLIAAYMQRWEAKHPHIKLSKRAAVRLFLEEAQQSVAQA